MVSTQIPEFQKSVESNLNQYILPFWYNHAVDEKYGGFVGKIFLDGNVEQKAYKGLILYARLLWSFSMFYRFDHHEKNLEFAVRAFNYLDKYFWDKQFGGAIWQVDYQGNIIDSKRKIYGLFAPFRNIR